MQNQNTAPQGAAQAFDPERARRKHSWLRVVKRKLRSDYGREVCKQQNVCPRLVAELADEISGYPSFKERGEVWAGQRGSDSASACGIGRSAALSARSVSLTCFGSSEDAGGEAILIRWRHCSTDGRFLSPIRPTTGHWRPTATGSACPLRIGRRCPP